MAAHEQRQFTEAEASYRKALHIYREPGDRRRTADVQFRLAWMAQDQRQYEEAEASYRNALDSYLEQGDRSAAARTYHNLGTLAEDQRQYETAKAHYREAPHIYLALADHQMAPISATQLGIVLAELGHHDEAVHSFVLAVLTGLQQSGNWLPKCVQWLHQEREVLGPVEFLARVQDQVPHSAAEFVTGIEAAWSTLSAVQAHQLTVSAGHALLHAIPRPSGALVHADPQVPGTDPYDVLADHRPATAQS